MILIIKLIIVCSFLVLGVKISTEENMLFGRIGEWANKQVDKGYKIWEAIILCPFCAPSVWSLVAIGFGYLFGWVDSWTIFYYYPVIVGGSSLCAGLVWTFYQLLSQVIKYFKYLNGEE